MGRRNNIRYLLLTFWLITSLFLSYCKKRLHFTTIGSIRIIVTDTFSSAPLDGITVEIDCNGIKTDGITHNGVVEFENPEINPINPLCDVKVNVSTSMGYTNPQYIPSLIHNVNLKTIDALYLDIVKRKDINPGGYPWEKVLNIYRSSDFSFSNLKWDRQPARWIILDPDRVLKRYPEPKKSPEFENIMKGFEMIEKYTWGAIKSPAPEDVEIIYRNINNPPTFSIVFLINTSSPPKTERYINGSIIFASIISANPRNLSQVFRYSISSIQGGNPRVPLRISIITGSKNLTEYDRAWGKFNFKLRETDSNFNLNNMGYPLVEIRILHFGF